MDGTCEICGNTANNRFYTAKEMNFGWKQSFLYSQCRECDCLQIDEIPNDLAKYYPADYSPFTIRKNESLKQRLKELLSARRLRNAYCGFDAIGSLLQKILGPPRPTGWFDPFLSLANVNSRVLDVGCAAGNLLNTLHKMGFLDLTGIDPYVQKAVNHNGVRILKQDLHTLDEQFDFVMLHHSFEHMANPHSIFAQLDNIMFPGASLLIRTPVVPSYAWEKYGTDWVQLDAPRHLFIHSIRSIRSLAGEVGLCLVDVEFDSTDFQFWGSEQYKIGLSLLDRNSHLINPEHSIFSDRQIDAFKEKAKELNGRGAGDQACFFLKKASR